MIMSLASFGTMVLYSTNFDTYPAFTNLIWHCLFRLSFTVVEPFGFVYRVWMRFPFSYTSTATFSAARFEAVTLTGISTLPCIWAKAWITERQLINKLQKLRFIFLLNISFL